MEEFTYEQIRTKALKQGIKDNKVHIGLWANLNNYLKTRRKKNGKVSTYYPLAELSQCILDSSNGSIINVI